MKKFILLIGLFIAMLASYSQTNATVDDISRSFPYRVVFLNDTLTNADTLIFTPNITYNSSTLPVNVQIECESVSGTQAATAQLQGSFDKIVWFNEGSAQTLTSNEETIVTDTAGAWLYYRLDIKSTGTQVQNIEKVTFYRME